jgi:hypothetical protein
MQLTITPSIALSPASTTASFVVQSVAHGSKSLAARTTGSTSLAALAAGIGCAEPHAANPIANHHLGMIAVWSCTLERAIISVLFAVCHERMAELGGPGPLHR